MNRPTYLALQSNVIVRQLIECKTVVIFFERERRGQYSNERSGASVEMAKESGITLTALYAFRKGKKTTVLKSRKLKPLY